MSDIVERLRQVAAAYKSLPTSGIWATMTVDRDASCNNLTDAADEIERLRAEAAGLRDALRGVLPWVVTQVVACNGLKCREAVCMSCDSDAEDNAQLACDAYAAADAAMKEQP